MLATTDEIDEIQKDRGAREFRLYLDVERGEWLLPKSVWLLQEKLRDVDATVLRENLVRLDGLPLVVRVSSLPDTGAGTRVRLGVKSIDLLERVIDCTYRETLPGSGAELAETAADAGEKA